MKTKFWAVSDKFWGIVEPLVLVPEKLPEQEYKRKVGGGRKSKAPRVVFSAIVYVLRTGMKLHFLRIL